MKLALAQINPTVGDFSGNARKILDFARDAAKQGAELVLFPELSVCGYPPADFLEKDAFLVRAQQTVLQIAAATAELNIAILCGTVTPSPQAEGKRVHNTAVLLANGRIVFEQHKMLLPFYDVFDEQRYFEPATKQELVEFHGETLAITICEDAWNDKAFWTSRLYQVDPVENLVRSAKSSPLLLNLSASPYWQGKRQLRTEMLVALAKRHHATVMMVNQVGGNDSLIFDGSSLVISPEGEVIAQAKSFAEELLVVDTAGRQTASAETIKDETDIAATYDALVLGTRDYVRKCGFSKVLIGLSGGIDSALVAAIAVDAMGKENVLGIGMPSQYSSQGSIDDSRQLASSLGIRYEVLPIRDIFDQYLSTLEPLFAGTPFGLAEENLQSRIRGVLLMALSNKFASLVLTTGNKSEMSTGYCTLYGDMVGALAVIGDVFKTRVYQLSQYVNREREIIPVATLTKPPSAELRPGQKDTDSLPPYDVLDPILEAYVERYESAEQIAYAQQLDLTLVSSVLKLVERSEYKRQQAAPVLKVTRKSFGTGRRFPIAVKVQV
ncbi:MAG: NAD+ synthase [Acidobacteriaceae bacterium]